MKQPAPDVVAVRFSGVPIDEAMKRVADALNATWIQEKGQIYRLTRTPAQVRAEREAELKFQAEAIQRAFAKKREELAKAKPWTQESAEQFATRMTSVLKTFTPNDRTGAFHRRLEQVTKELPTTRALDQMALLLNPVELAGIPPQIKVVFSTNPTPTQRRMPAQVANVIADYVRDMRLWQEAREKRGVQNPTYYGATYIFQGLEDAEKLLSKAPAKVLLCVSRWGVEPGFSLELILADDRGTSLIRAHGSLSGNPYDEALWKEPEVKPNQDTISLEGDELEVWKAMRQRHLGAETPETIRQRINQPEEHEPLAMMGSSSLLKVASMRNQNLIAVLPDNAFGLLMTDKPMPIPTYMARLAQVLKLVDQDGWLTLTPKMPAFTRSTRVDRKVLGQYLRAVSAGKAQSLEERAKYALLLPRSSLNSLPQILSTLLLSTSEMPYYNDDGFLRLFGALSPEQKRAATGGGLSLRSFSPQQIELVREMLYGPYVNLQLRQEPGQQPPVDFQLFYNGLMREPTESLPNGPRPDGVLKITETRSEVVGTMPTPVQGWVQPPRHMSADELAWQSYAQEHPDTFPWMAEEGQRLDLTRLRFGSRRQLNITLGLSPILELSGQLAEHHLDGEPRAVSALPEAFRKQFEAKLAEHVKNHSNRQSGFGPTRGTTIPPAT